MADGLTREERATLDHALRRAYGVAGFGPHPARSFKAVNSQSGIFYVDWFYGGGSSSFCCNQSVASLGAFNDTFSSVRRT